MRDVRAVAPWLEVADSAMVRRLSELSLLAGRLFFEIQINGAFDDQRQPRFVLDTYRRMVLAQTALARELGLSPLARKQLSLAAQTDDLAAALAKRVQSDGDEQ
jgi:hypothetical protein